jgi:hypothetical protein
MGCRHLGGWRAGKEFSDDVLRAREVGSSYRLEERVLLRWETMGLSWSGPVLWLSPFSSVGHSRQMADTRWFKGEGFVL